jgi:plasmid stabilization system protein ParE
MPGFDLSVRARGDLVEIGVYGAERWGAQRSERYVSEFYILFQWLVEGRSIGRRCERVRPAFGALGTRVMSCSSGGSLTACSSAGFCISANFQICTRLTTTNSRVRVSPLQAACWRSARAAQRTVRAMLSKSKGPIELHAQAELLCAEWV